MLSPNLGERWVWRGREGERTEVIEAKRRCSYEGNCLINLVISSYFTRFEREVGWQGRKEER